MDRSSKHLDSMNEEKIKVGDLVRIKLDSWPGTEPRDFTNETLLHAYRNVTGIVVDRTLSDHTEKEDYWVNVVFLDGSRATLFHDEVDIIK